jgi:hypothetical protein
MDDCNNNPGIENNRNAVSRMTHWNAERQGQIDTPVYMRLHAGVIYRCVRQIPLPQYAGAVYIALNPADNMNDASFCHTEPELS